MDLQALGSALEASPIGDFVASDVWAFPTIECLHVIALVTVIGTITVVDLRLLGWGSRPCAVTEIANDTLPWTWAAFVLAAITGSLLFVSKAHIYVQVPWFWLKMSTMLLAGINMAVFHFFTWRSVDKWDVGSEVPMAGKIAAGLSLIFWILVVVFGRKIGFVLDVYE
jgi:hypothetical protein